MQSLAKIKTLQKLSKGYVHSEAILAALWGQKMKIAFHKFLIVSLLE